MEFKINDINAFEYIAWLGSELDKWFKEFTGMDDAYLTIDKFDICPEYDDDNYTSFVSIKGRIGNSKIQNEYYILTEAKDLDKSFIKGFITCFYDREGGF